jgi:hypothetical protein
LIFRNVRISEELPVTPFAPDQWVILLLMFLLGLFMGMYLLSGRKWKRRYREEVAHRERLEREHRESDSLRRAEAEAERRHPITDHRPSAPTP